MKNKPIKLFAFALMALALISVLLAACARSGSSTTSGEGSSGSGTTSGGGQSSSASSSATVHMGDTNFLQNSVTISKGGKVTLVDDSAVIHIIQNGSWVNGAAQTTKEPGAPPVQVSFQGKDTHDIGPFNTAGTFHVYCTVHTGMNLAITVQ